MSSEDSQKRLDSVLKELDHKRRNFLLLKGIAGFALVLLAAIFIVSLLSFLYNNTTYYIILKALVAVAAAYAVYRFIYRPLAGDGKWDGILRELDGRSSGLGEDTLNASQLKSVPAGEESGTSAELAEAHIGRVAERLQSLDSSTFFPIKRLKGYAIPLAAAVIFASLVLSIGPRGFTSYLLSASLYPSDKSAELELADIEIRLDYPAYAEIPPGTIRGGTGDIEALKGTWVKFKARTLGKFNSGKLITDSGTAYPVRTENGVITAEFPVLENGTYRVAEESSGLTTGPFKITVEEDNPPSVKITSPEDGEIIVGRDDRINIEYEAEDDYGLTEFRLTWESESGKSGKPIGRADQDADKYNDRYTFDVGGADFGGGDTLRLRVEAYDNDTVSGPKTGESNALTVRLKDPEQKHGEVMSLAEKLMERIIEVLGDEIEISGLYKNVATKDGVNANDHEVSLESRDIDEIVSTQNGLTRKIEAASTTLYKLLGNMTDDVGSDYTYFVGFANMEQRVNTLIDERREILDSFAVVDIPRLGRLMKRETGEFEDDILFIDSMIKSEKLRDSLQAGRELMSKYGELSELLKKMNETGDEKLKAEIQKKLDQLRGLMSELAQKMSAMSGEIQEGFLNRDAFKAMDTQQKLDEIMKLMEEGNIEEAMDMLASLQNSLQNMLASLESGFQSFSAGAMSQDMSKLNELVARINGLEQEESALREKTEGLKQSLLDNPGSEGDNLRRFIERQKEKVDDIKENLLQAKSKITEEARQDGSPDGSYLLDTLIKKADELKNWLDAMDIGEAAKVAEKVETTGNGLLELSDAGVGSLGKARPEIKSSAGTAGEIKRALERFMRSGENVPQSESIAKRQDEIRQDTDGLSQDTQKLMEDILLSPGVGEKIGEAEGHMGKASESLNGNELSKAISNQDEAVKALQEAKGEAQDLLQKMQARAQGGGTPVPMVLGQRQQSRGMQGTDTRYVEIPAAGETELGKEFKQRILEAMKGGSPEGYGELNKKYYDRIIK